MLGRDAGQVPSSKEHGEDGHVLILLFLNTFSRLKGGLEIGQRKRTRRSTFQLSGKRGEGSQKWKKTYLLGYKRSGGTEKKLFKRCYVNT